MEKQKLEIELKQEFSKDKDDKVVYMEEKKLKCPNCGSIVREAVEKQPLYKQNDGMALIQVLSLYDSRKGGLKDYKTFINLREKIEKAWVKETKKVELSLDEMSFLKNFLSGIFDKEKKKEEKIQLSIFLGRTVISVLEQLE